MDKKRPPLHLHLLPVILLLLFLLLVVVAQGSESSSGTTTTTTALLGRLFRRMVMDGINNPPANTTQVSPSPSPISVTGSDLVPVPVPVEDSSNFPPAANKPPPPPPLDPPPPSNQLMNPSPSQITSKEDSNQQGTTMSTTDNCEASSNKCMDQTMTACLQHPPKQILMGIQEFTLLVQNEGESSLKVNIIVPASVKIDLKELQIPKHQAKKINVLVNAGESPKVVLNAGYGDCVLQAGTPIAQGNIFHQIPSYTTLLTPVYGAYFFFLITLIVGGIWACCKFGKRGRQQGGIPYQELEMGMAGSSGSAINVETADGWDQSWDDDWDEDKAVISPVGGQHVGNVSANGLTSRSSNKEGWGNDWDE